MPRRSAQAGFLDGRVILIVHRTWIIARGLANAFEAKGAQVSLARTPHSDLANLPNLAAAVLDGASHELCRQLQARGIPFVLYTAREQVYDVPIIRKPAPAAEVVARVEELLAPP